MAFTATTVLGKKFFDVWVYSSASGWTNSDADWGTKIGKIDGEALMKAGAGDTIRLADGIDAMISENGEVSFTLLGHNSTAAIYATNYTELKTLINNPANVVFVPSGAANKATENYKISGMYLFPELNIQANQLNKIMITAKKEASPGTAVTLNAANNQ